MKRPKNPFSFWSEMDERKRTDYRIVFGVVTALVTVFTAIAVCSYFFTWKQDASLVGTSDLMDPGVPVHNTSSKLGFRWGYFLVTRSFGIAALGVVAFLTALSLQLLWPKVRISLGKWFLSSFTGTLIASWILSYASRIAGWDDLFGGGPGGRCGTAVVGWAVNGVGIIVTGFILLAAAALWIYFLSDRFAAFSADGRMELEEDPEEGFPVREPERVAEPVPEPEPEPEPVRKPEPRPEPDPKPEGEGAEEGSFGVVTDDTLDQEVRNRCPASTTGSMPRTAFRNTSSRPWISSAIMRAPAMRSPRMNSAATTTRSARRSPATASKCGKSQPSSVRLSPCTRSIRRRV